MAKDNPGDYPKLVEGYNMLIWENQDGTAFYTGSLNLAEWNAYLDKSGNNAAETVEVPPEAPAEEPAPADEVDPDEETADSLRDKARERGLPVSGTKAELASRLRKGDSA